MANFEIHCFSPQKQTIYDVPNDIIPLDAVTLNAAYHEFFEHCAAHETALGNNYYGLTAFSPDMVRLFIHVDTGRTIEDWILEDNRERGAAYA